MATTTNYGWTTPDDTALVKDGAAAIRTLGSSVDTTTKALNPSTTLGDIEYRSSTANTNTRLGIGTTGQVLSVSGGVPAWATPAAGGGMTLLSTTTLSGATTTISSISQNYNQLFITLENVISEGNGQAVTMRFNADSGNNYYWSQVNVEGFTVYANSSKSTSSIRLYIGTNSATQINQGNGYIQLINYVSTGTKTAISSLKANVGGNDQLALGNHFYIGGSAITEIQFLAGTSFTSGTVKIWGLK